MRGVKVHSAKQTAERATVGQINQPIVNVGIIFLGVF